MDLQNILIRIDQLPLEQQLRIQEHIELNKQKRQPKPEKRVAGLGRGKGWMSDDFDDELPDVFWGFDERVDP